MLQKQRNKKGSFEIAQFLKLLLFVIVLVVVIAGGFMILFGSGGKLLSGIREIFRFGA